MVDQSQKAGLSFEEICRQIFAEQSAWRKVLIGCVLCLSVFGSPFAFGYIWRYMAKLRATGDFTLPEWDEPLTLLIPGLKAMIVFFAWCGVPSLIALALQAFFFEVTWVLGFPAVVITAVVLWGSSCLGVSALWHFQREPEWETLMQFERIWAPFGRAWSQLLLPGMAYVGFLALLSPLLLLVFFGGFLPFMAYALQAYVFSSRAN